MVQLLCQTSQEIGENKIGISTEDSLRSGLNAGSPVKVVGNKSTVAQIVVSDEFALALFSWVQQCELTHLFLNVMRLKSPIECKRAPKDTLPTFVEGFDEHILDQVVSRLIDVYVSKGDRFVVQVNGEPVEICATRVRPGHGWLVERRFAKWSRAANARTNIPSVSFEDIGGLDETIEEIKEIAIVPLLHPEVYQKAGQDPPKDSLYGPPGVGKTLLAKALAREAQCNFMLINGPGAFRPHTVSPSVNFVNYSNVQRKRGQRLFTSMKSMLLLDLVRIVRGNSRREFSHNCSLN